MQTPRRVWLMVGLLAAAGASQTLIWRHVQAADVSATVPLEQPLATMPLTLGRWQGRDVPLSDIQAALGDDRVSRVYVDSVQGQTFTLWMVFSASGDDRLHHPEVCLAAAGWREDPTGRRELALGDHGEPVVQFRFVQPSSGAGQRVFYWYYTLAGSRQARPLSWLQRNFAAARRPASLTIELFASDCGVFDDAGAADLVRELETALRAHVPPGAARGSRRLQYLMVGDGRLRQTGE